MKHILLPLISLALLYGLWHFRGELAEVPPSPQILTGAHLKPTKANDGDSFWVRLPDGNEQQYRLYYVDAPETSRRSYRNGDTNHQRIRQQADYFGISEAQAMQVGKEAKRRVHALLSKNAFEVHSQGELVYSGPRHYAFIRVLLPEGPRWLHEILVEEGLARLHTKGLDLPGGNKLGEQDRWLESLEQAAKDAGRGAWRFRSQP